ncbi:MAG TPA: ParA family protein [Candidatus Saccharimonadales bacterium]|nr:ParA family protein [Candidatus Saccharimonadales bacterium]
MKIIAILNQKGGVGKTTTAVNFSAGLARVGKKIMFIDADLQANATAALNLTCKQVNDIACDLLALLTRQCTLQQAIIARSIQYKNKSMIMDVIPATVALSGFDQIVRALPNKQLLLKQLLGEVEQMAYDYIVIDCPPSLGLMTVNALVAADELIIPVQPEFFALQGVGQLLQTVDTIQKNFNSRLTISGVLCTRFNRRKIHNEVFNCLQDRFGKDMFATKIHENIAIAEAPSFGQTIFEYNPDSSGSYDYEMLCKEFTNREITRHQMNIPLKTQKQMQR